MPRADGRDVQVFDRDASTHGGYLYTTNQTLSSRLATSRSTDLIMEFGRFAGRSVLDIGCGDGFYMLRFWDRGHPRRIVAVDAAKQALRLAKERRGERRIQCVVGDGHRLPFADDTFDLVLVQSILHHDDDPGLMIREVFRVAREILIHEPNGNNPGLKIIERTSWYHIEHREKSYTSRQMRRWIERAGGVVTGLEFAGFVPMFCPDWLARALKTVEPLVERTPILNAVGCAVYVLVATRRPASAPWA